MERGLLATVRLASVSNNPQSVYKVKNVNVKVNSLKFSIRDAKHATLHNTPRPLATGPVTEQIQKALSDVWTTNLEYADGRFVGVRNRINETKESGEGSGTKVLQGVRLLPPHHSNCFLILMFSSFSAKGTRGRAKPSRCIASETALARRSEEWHYRRS